MGIKSGLLAKISVDGATSAVTSVRNWRMPYKANNVTGAASSADQGMQFAVAGVKEWGVTFDFYNNTIPILPGASASFVGHNGTERHTGTILCTGFSLQCDIEGGGIIGGSATCVGNSALTLSSTTTVIPDTSVPTVFGGVGCKAQWATIAASPSYADIAGVRSWGLDIQCQANPYAIAENTSGLKLYTAGPKSAKATVNTYQDTPSGLTLLPGVVGALKLFVGSTFFELRWVIVDDNDEATDIEGGKPDEIAHAFTYSGWNDIAGTMTKGYIHKPGAVAIWP